jgi:hypothetical protein
VQQRAVGARDELGGGHARRPLGHAGGRAGPARGELPDRGGEPRERALGDGARLLLVGLDGDEGELVAAVAGGEVVGSGGALERRADAPQQLVAHEVPVLLVDLREVVEVEQHERERRGHAALDPLDLAAQALVQRGVVEAARERVGAGEDREARVARRVLARDGRELGEGLEHLEIAAVHAAAVREADRQHAARLLVPRERHGERGLDEREGRARGGARDALVVVRQHRPVRVEHEAREAGARLEGVADDLGCQVVGGHHGQPLDGRAAVDDGEVAVEDCGRLLADAGEQRRDVERLVERLRGTRQRALSLHLLGVLLGDPPLGERRGGRARERCGQLALGLAERVGAARDEHQDVARIGAVGQRDEQRGPRVDVGGHQACERRRPGAVDAQHPDPALEQLADRVVGAERDRVPGMRARRIACHERRAALAVGDVEEQHRVDAEQLARLVDERARDGRRRALVEREREEARDRLQHCRGRRWRGRMRRAGGVIHPSMIGVAG